MISKTRLKYLRSLRQKKIRSEEGALLVEGLNVVEEAVAAYVRLLTAYLDRFYSRGFTAHQPLDQEDPGTGFGVREQEFFHSLALGDGDLDALEKEVEQAFQSGNPEWAWRARERLVEHLRGYCRPKTITWNLELLSDLPESENPSAASGVQA